MKDLTKLLLRLNRRADEKTGDGRLMAAAADALRQQQAWIEQLELAFVELALAFAQGRQER